MSLTSSSLYDFFSQTEAVRLSGVSITFWQEAGVWCSQQGKGKASIVNVQRIVKPQPQQEFTFIPLDSEIGEVKRMRSQRPLDA